MNYLELYDSYLGEIVETISGDVLSTNKETEYKDPILFDEETTATVYVNGEVYSEEQSKRDDTTEKSERTYTYITKTKTITSEDQPSIITVNTLRNVPSSLTLYTGEAFNVTPKYRFLRIKIDGTLDEDEEVKEEIFAHTYKYVKEKLKELITLRDGLQKGMKNLFTNPKDSFQTEGMNLISINGVGNSSKGYEKMDISSSGEITFSDTYDLWYARGELYNIYDTILKSNWLKSKESYFTNIKSRIVKYISQDEQQHRYYSSPYVAVTTVTATSASGTTKNYKHTFTETANFTKMKEDVDELMTKFDNLKMFYPGLENNGLYISEFENTLCAFNYLSTEYSNLIVFGQYFIEAYANTGYDSESVLYDTYASIGNQGGFSLTNQSTLNTCFSLVKQAFNIFRNSQYASEVTEREAITSYVNRIYTCLCYEIPTTTSWSWTEDSETYYDTWREIDITDEDRSEMKNYLKWYNQYTGKVRYYFHEYQSGTSGTTLSLNLYEKASLIYAKIKHLKYLIEID